eukprot:Rhum_TRINITY_DN9436_c0_g1::Rhum_TRINITY_DN9436_c0_g1_i1::g.33281::m.33281
MGRDGVPVELVVNVGRLPAASGCFNLADETHNNEPVWLGTFGKRLFSAKGRWYVGNVDTMSKDSGWIRSAPHGGTHAPHSVEGAWEAFEKVGMPWRADASIDVALRQHVSASALMRDSPPLTDDTGSLWEGETVSVVRDILRGGKAPVGSKGAGGGSGSVGGGGGSGGAGGKGIGAADDVLRPTPFRPPLPPAAAAAATPAATATAAPGAAQSDSLRAENAELRTALERLQKERRDAPRAGAAGGGGGGDESAHLRAELDRARSERQLLSAQVAQMAEASAAAERAFQLATAELTSANASRDTLADDLRAKDAVVSSLTGELQRATGKLSSVERELESLSRISQRQQQHSAGSSVFAADQVARLRQWAYDVLES